MESGKQSTCQCRRHRFDPWPGKTLHATEQLSLSGKLLSLRPGAWGLQLLSLFPEPELHRREANEVRGLPTAAREWPLLTTAREEPTVTTAREEPTVTTAREEPTVTTAREGSLFTTTREEPAQQ